VNALEHPNREKPASNHPPFLKRGTKPQPWHRLMHMAFIWILLKKDLSRAYIIIHEATTQHVKTRQWVKKHVIRASFPKNMNNTPPYRYRGITESPYAEAGAHIC
jgi:hypothetical protein